jgi:putative membrane protein
MKKLTFALVGLLAAFSFAAGASAQETASEQDRTFLTKNQQTNLAEITTGNLAVEKGGPMVQSMARQIVADHQTASQQNKAASDAVGVTQPTEPNEMQKQQAATLQGLSGAEFDRAWLQIQIEGHRMAVADADTEIKTGTNAQVKTYAQTFLPVAQGHLDAALEMAPTPAGGVDTGAGGIAPDSGSDGRPWLLGLGGVALLALAGLAATRFGFARTTR